ncbi:EsaB/YukD family protein [Sporolactobacillus laevolacticus]|uniref:Ubiquitin n=1 Tax=Sporolactobacillus laevolacticus DSM 442 TaxID=1395513 RepID=V6IY51_9BACL|nr:EsaB/YukD family protein [Sporolactobacillus laevolacticus]EST12378.1 ubiquitin [Sporolactobacillus laevolacticus DSM 442]
MYINITVDLSHYRREPLDLRISDRQPVKQLIRTVWRIAGIQSPPREGYWVRVANKSQMIRGFDVLGDKKISDGDKLTVL